MRPCGSITSDKPASQSQTRFIKLSSVSVKKRHMMCHRPKPDPDPHSAKPPPVQRPRPKPHRDFVTSSRDKKLRALAVPYV